ncbi:MAG: BON domain-containing protein [Rhizobiales bacterium]|nr:BON domain-containing protein [Hyphomicrobiales bacterium]
MTVIAMTREMGSLGKDVALGLSVQLGFAVVHHELVEREVAERMDVRESEVHRFLEGSASMFERWKIDQSKLSSYSAEEILQIARKDNVLIRGWGATELLKDVPHVIRVRVCAPMAVRIARMMKRMDVKNPDVARREIERSDSSHTRVARKFFDADWEDPVNYHMVLNTGEVPVEACIDQVRLMTENPVFATNETSRAVIADKIIEARIRAALDADAVIGIHGRSFDIEVNDGRVMLSGYASNQGQIDSVAGMLGKMDGVIDVQNEILVMANTPLV